MLAHEQLVARGVFVPDAGGRFVQPRRSYRFDDQDPPAPRPAPALGEHTAQVLGELGYDAAALAQLRSECVIP